MKKMIIFACDIAGSVPTFPGYKLFRGIGFYNNSLTGVPRVLRDLPVPLCPFTQQL